MRKLKLAVREDRVREVSFAIRKFGLDNLKKLEERDPQYGAVRFVVERSKSLVEATTLIVANALVSYRLTGPGESYWWEFAREAVRKDPLDVVEFFKGFLKRSKYNRLLADQKLSRIRRFTSSQACQELIAKLVEEQWSTRDALQFWLELKRIYGSQEQKTVSFAVKMLYYAARCTGRSFELPNTIPVPVDLRVSMVTATSMLVSNTNWRLVWRELYTKSRRLVVEAWRRVSAVSGIPPLHIDVLLWSSAFEIKSAGFECERAVRAIAESLYAKLDRRVSRSLCRRVAVELSRSLCTL